MIKSSHPLLLALFLCFGVLFYLKISSKCTGTHGLADAIHHAAEPAADLTRMSTVGLPVAGAGSVGAWLEHSASPVERKNFFELVFLLSTFEKRLGLQQGKRSSANGGLEIQLGTKLRCLMEFKVVDDPAVAGAVPAGMGPEILN